MTCEYGCFHEDLLPDRMSLGMMGGPEYMTDIVTSRSGREERNALWSRARRTYDVKYGMRKAEDVHVIRRFHLARFGKAHPFRVRDWGDFSTAPGEGAEGTTPFDDTLATVADLGGNTRVPLYRTYQSGGRIIRRRIYKPRPCGFRIALDGVELTTGWSLDPARGFVEFDAMPTGTCLTWGGVYDTPVRFDADRLEASMEMVHIGEYPSVPLIEVLDERDIWPETKDDAIRAHLGSSDAKLAEFPQIVDEFGTFVEGLFA